MIQGIHRHFQHESILLDLDSYLEVPEDWHELTNKLKMAFKKSLFKTMIGLLDKSGQVNNPSKCLTDLINREAKATTALGEGIAIPHVRTMQARNMSIALMRSEKGIPFDSLDGELVHIFVGIICPPYDDKKYLKFLSELSSSIREGVFFDIIMGAESPEDIIGFFCRM